MTKKMGKRKKIIATIIGGAIIASMIPFGFLRAKSVVYVDANASGTMDGSYSHPYKKIQDGIDKAKKKKRNVSVKKGTYKENIKISSDVKVYGTDRDEVIITAKNKNKPVVTMKDDTTIERVTIKKGEVGVLIKEDDAAIVKNCKITNNDKDGIRIKSASKKEKYQAQIYDSYIAKNGWNGIYSEKRRTIIKNNDIYKNDKDGIELAKGARGSIKKNHIKDNDGDGIKVTIDGSKIWIDRNTVRGNERDGLEVRAYGDIGYIGVKENKFYRNDRWGISRIERKPFNNNNWNSSLSIEGDNIFWENNDGTVSPIINVY